MEISAAAGRVGGAAAVQRTEAAVACSGEAAEQIRAAAPAPRETGAQYEVASPWEVRGVPPSALVEAVAPSAETEAAGLAVERPEAPVREGGGAPEAERGLGSTEPGRAVRVGAPAADQTAELREAGRAAGEEEAGDRALARSAETAYAAAVSTLTAQAKGETTELFV